VTHLEKKQQQTKSNCTGSVLAVDQAPRILICLAHCIYFGDPAGIEKKILEKKKARGGWGEILPKAIMFSRE
jgi:hypothetical protein